MSWEEDFRRNIERTRQRIMEIAPDMLDLNAHHSAAGRPPPRTGAQSTHGARPCTSTAEPSFIARFRTTSDTPRATPVSPTDETSTVDPLRPGPYPTCASAPTRALDIGLVPVHVIAYAPGTQISSNMCESAAKDCPLAVLFHARGVALGQPNTYLSYEKLGRHLASYGFAVVSVEWEPVETQADDGVLLAPILESINNGLLGLIKILSGQLVLIGHSHGGFVVDRSVNSGLITTGFKLSAVVLMSPSDVNMKSNTYTDPAIDALLVLHDVLDQDPGANGGGSGFQTALPPSGVIAYELAGHPNGGDVNAGSPQNLKHFAYAHLWGSMNQCPEGMSGSHYYHETTFAIGYIASFLLAYVRGHAAYRSFFRRQLPISGMTDVVAIDGIPGIWHMHAEPSEHILFSWASPMAMADVTGGKSERITLPQGNKYSLNHGQVLQVQFTRGMECVVTMSFAATAKLMEYSLISFGLCQSNIDGYDNISGPATDGTLVGTISLANAQSNEMYSVKLMDIGGPLWYHGCLKGRRVCMEERVLPLSSVAAAVKLDSINRIIFRINASDAPGEDAAFFVGNIKLIGKGP